MAKGSGDWWSRHDYWNIVKSTISPPFPTFNRNKTYISVKCRNIHSGCIFIKKREALPGSAKYLSISPIIYRNTCIINMSIHIPGCVVYKIMCQTTGSVPGEWPWQTLSDNILSCSIWYQPWQTLSDNILSYIIWYQLWQGLTYH